MTADLATALLNRAANGAELLEVLETITADVEQENIADAAAHYAAISAHEQLERNTGAHYAAATLEEVQF